MYLTNKRYLIKTQNGFEPFEGISKSIHTFHKKLTFANGKNLICSDEHIFYFAPQISINAISLRPGMKIYATDGNYYTIESVDEIEETRELYDIINVGNKTNTFTIEDSILTHNCQFLTFEKTLIDSEIMDFYSCPEPLEELEGFKVFVDKLSHPDSLIVVTIDPSSGGEDNSAIQVWEIAPRVVIQLMSFADEYADASVIFEKILWLQKFLETKFKYEPSDAMIVFERNGIGEGLVQILTQTEKAIENLEMPIYYDGKNKAGIHLGQTLKNKLALQFKTLFEYGKIIINDIEELDELYGFIRQGGSYSAKSGYKDDRVMATFYIVFYVMNVFNEFANGDFSVDSLILVTPEEKIVPVAKPALTSAQINEQQVKEAMLKMEEQQALTPMSIVEEENEDDDIDYDSFGILPVG